MRLHRSESLWGAALLVLLAVSQQCVSADTSGLAPPEVKVQNGTMYAACKLRPISSLPDGLPRVYGQVVFKQHYPDGKLNVIFHINGFPKNATPEPRIAVHIHQYGNLDQQCRATGGHYNPNGVHHPNHPGDFGNLQPQGGKLHMLMESEATLFGAMSVIGRAVVVHEKMDDLGLGGDAESLLHGNAGQRIGCCVIGITPPDLWNMYHQRFKTDS